jgi:hypothetical protein
LNSDGGVALSGVIEEHYTRGIDILAVTDHSEFEHFFFSNPVTSRGGITQERWNVIASGSDRNGRGMLIIPNTSEQRVGGQAEEVNAFFYETAWQSGNNFNGLGGWGTNFNRVMTEIQKQNGLAFINHPGRTTGGNVTTILGTNAVNNPLNINNYVGRFMAFQNCVGMEIVNRITDEDSLNDRIFWDNVNKVTIPQGRYVWGFSNDDSHSNNNIGHNINMFLMPENTLENFRSTMMNGNFYAVARRVRNEGVNLSASNTTFNPVTDPFPAITSITVCQTELTITINATGANKIVWISGVVGERGGTELATKTGTDIFPATFALADFEEELGVFVRANIIGPGGIAFTQPFGIQR